MERRGRGKNGEEGPVRSQRKEASVSNHIYFVPICRVWDVNNGSMVKTLVHHTEAVMHLKFNSNTMVTSSRVLDYITHSLLCILKRFLILLKRTMYTCVQIHVLVSFF